MKRVKSALLESVMCMLVIVSALQDQSCAPLDAEKERDRILPAVDKLYVQQDGGGLPRRCQLGDHLELPQ
ncbi:MAG: hypothetical protein LUQ08_03540 [Methanothrix sp.]|nr:hypothetical protein [Methanothrix sp.]